MFSLVNELFFLVNARDEARKYPETFECPTDRDITSYIQSAIRKQGFAHIKCCFHHHGSDHSERMWIMVKDFHIENETHNGILDNDPITEEQAKMFKAAHGIGYTFKFADKLKAGDTVEFKLEHVYSTM